MSGPFWFIWCHLFFLYLFLDHWFHIVLVFVSITSSNVYSNPLSIRLLLGGDFSQLTLSCFAIPRFHRLTMSSTHNGTTLFTPQFGCSKDQNISCSSGSGLTSTAQIFNHKALHPWVHRQSSLPPSVISSLTLSAAEGGLWIKYFIIWKLKFFFSFLLKFSYNKFSWSIKRKWVS